MRLIPQGCAPHTAGNHTDAFLSFLFVLGTAKQEWHTEIVLILLGPICCTLLWFSFIAAEGILRRVDKEQLLISHTFFCLYKNLTLLRALRIFWRSRTMFQLLALAPNIWDCREELRLPVGISALSSPWGEWREAGLTEAAYQHVLSLCRLGGVAASSQLLNQWFCLECVQQHTCAKPP